MVEKGTSPVGAEERERLAQHVARTGGVPRLVELTGIPPRTVEKALAGLRLRELEGHGK
jgi:hypothetical protein